MRALRTLLIAGLIGLLVLGGVAVWSLQADSEDFAFVPRAAQPAIGVVELEGAAPPTRRRARAASTSPPSACATRRCGRPGSGWTAAR